MKRQLLMALATFAVVATAITSARIAGADEVFRTAGLSGGATATQVVYRPYYRAYRPYYGGYGAYGVYRPYVTPYRAYAYPYRAYRPYVVPYRPYAYPYRTWRGPARYWW